MCCVLVSVISGYSGHSEVGNCRLGIRHLFVAVGPAAVVAGPRGQLLWSRTGQTMWHLKNISNLSAHTANSLLHQEMTGTDNSLSCSLEWLVL